MRQQVVDAADAPDDEMADTATVVAPLLRYHVRAGDLDRQAGRGFHRY